MAIVRRHHAQIEASALHKGVACTQQTLAFFPALHAMTILAQAARNKVLLDIDAHFADQFISHCTPRLVLFPQITDAAHSQLRPLDETQTILRLIPQSAGVLVDARHTLAQLAVLRALIQQTQSYCLLLGRDVHTEPATVSALLRQALEAKS